jgi:hypothetical protein
MAKSRIDFDMQRLYIKQEMNPGMRFFTYCFMAVSVMLYLESTYKHSLIIDGVRTMFPPERLDIPTDDHYITDKFEVIKACLEKRGGMRCWALF